MKPLELENWIVGEGDRIIRKAADTSLNALEARDQLIYEIWLFDTEQRNGGVSQYFCNRGLERWETLSKMALPAVPSFGPFADVVNRVVSRSIDPYQTILNSDVDLDACYEKCRTNLLLELKEMK